MHPGNSPLTFWNSLLKTDHLPCRIVSAEGERSPGEKCASAAATWCVWAKTQTTPGRAEVVVRSMLEAVRGLGRARRALRCPHPPPSTSTMHRWPRCRYGRSSSAWWLRCGCAAADWRSAGGDAETQRNGSKHARTCTRKDSRAHAHLAHSQGEEKGQERASVKSARTAEQFLGSFQNKSRCAEQCLGCAARKNAWLLLHLNKNAMHDYFG